MKIPSDWIVAGVVTIVNVIVCVSQHYNTRKRHKDNAKFITEYKVLVAENRESNDACVAAMARYIELRQNFVRSIEIRTPTHAFGAKGGMDA